MRNYFSVPNSTIKDLPLPINKLLERCDKPLRLKFEKYIVQCSIYSVIREKPGIGPYFNEILIIDLQVISFDDIQKLVTYILKAVKYQTIICAHSGEKVCFFSGIVRPQKLRTYEVKIDSLYRSRIYSIADGELQIYSLSKFSNSSLKELYREVSEIFELSNKDTLSTTFVGQLYTYVCGMEPDFLQYRSYIVKYCENIEVFLDNGAIKTVHTYQQVYEFLQSRTILSGEDLIEVISDFINYETDFDLPLPPSLQLAIDKYDGDNYNEFLKEIDNVHSNKPEEETDCYEESEDFGDDCFSSIDDLFYSC